jgi:flagellar hook-associated protein 3 FlgL
VTVSDIAMFSQLSFSLDQTLDNIQNVEQELGTGKRVNEPSDDPVSYASAQLLNTEQSAVSNDLSLAQQSRGELSTIDSTLSTVADAVNTAITTATQGADGRIPASQMQTLATQAQSILTEVIGSANMQYEGACVFGGDQVLSPPYSAKGVYSGDNSTNSVTFSDGTTAQMTFAGQSIFGDNTGGPISALNSLVTALNKGDHAGVSATLPQLETALQTLSLARSTVGSNVDTLNNLVTSANGTMTTLQSTASDLVDGDVAQLAMQAQETTLQQQALVQLGSSLGQIAAAQYSRLIDCFDLFTLLMKAPAFY